MRRKLRKKRIVEGDWDLVRRDEGPEPRLEVGRVRVHSGLRQEISPGGGSGDEEERGEGQIERNNDSQVR